MKLCDEIFLTFVSNFPKEILDMKMCDHNYSLEYINPYHAEGDVWTHTVMAYKEAVKNYAPKEVLFSALLHDIGKPFCCVVNHETKRVSFNGHEGISFFKAVRVLNHKCFAHLLNEEEKNTILKLIACHSRLFDYKKSKIPLSEQFKNQQPFLNLLAQQVQADSDGRIAMNAKYKNYDELIKGGITKNVYNDKFLPELIVLIGPSRVGKSTFIHEAKYHETHTIISRDYFVNVRGTGKTYKERWDSLSKIEQKTIDATTLKSFNDAVKKKENIIIDMTNMSKKSRRKWLNNLKDYFVRAKVFVDEFENILNRRDIDEIKKIRKSVIIQHMKAFSFPLSDEFECVEMIRR